jgi:hypothetical protein
LACLVWGLIRFYFNPAPVAECVPEAPAIPPAIVIHLSFGQRIKSREYTEEDYQEARRRWNLQCEIEGLTQ